MEPVLDALTDAAANGLMPRGASLLLAVSGGADSLALLHGTAECAAAAGWSLAVGHVHHGWRGREANRDLSFVRDNARRLGIPFFLARRDARGEARDLKLSPEAGARHARYAALHEMATEAGCDLIATAHQRGDRVETYLLARERGAGLAGLAGLQRRRSDGVVRPLLEVSRHEILAFLRVRGLAHRRDASNGDLRLARNRIRRAVLALLAERGEEALRELEAEAERFSRDRDALEREFARSVEPRIFRGQGTVVADAPYLQACGHDLQRLAIERAALPFARPGKAPLTGREREQILVRLRGGGDFRFEAGRRIRFDRRGPVLRIELVPARSAGGSPPGQ